MCTQTTPNFLYRLSDLNSGPHDCTARALTHRVISTAHFCFLGLWSCGSGKMSCCVPCPGTRGFLTVGDLWGNADGKVRPEAECSSSVTGKEQAQHMARETSARRILLEDLTALSETLAPLLSPVWLNPMALISGATLPSPGGTRMC